MSKIKVSIVILNYNSNKEVLGLLRSIRKSDFKNKFEIIIVDNSETPELNNHFKKGGRILYIKNEKNVGYGVGNNIGVRNAKGEYIFILNADTKIYKNTIQHLSDFLDKNKDVAIAAPSIINEKGVIINQLGQAELTPVRAIFSLSFIHKLFPGNSIAKSYYGFSPDKKLPYEVGSAPGSAFMIRKRVFIKAGMFDEKMFMYFEESDLGKRIQKLGYRLFITPLARVKHKWGAHLNDPLHKRLFTESRFYYFRKHYGLPNALMVELFCRLSLYDLLFILIVTFAYFLRFYKLQETFNFDSEVADNLLQMKNYIVKDQIPLLGPPTSHPWLAFPPLFYWFYIPILIVTKYDPYSHFLVGGLINLSAVPIYYFLVKKYLGKSEALLTAILLSFSPFLIIFSQSARFYTYVIPISTLLAFFLFKLKEAKNLLFFLFLSIGIMLSFHFTPLILIPGVVIIYVKKHGFRLKDIIVSTVGFVIPLLPLLIYDSKQGFAMFSKLLMWIPYKLLGFSGLFPKNPVYSFGSNIASLIDFVRTLFSYNNWGITLLVTVMVLYAMFKYRKLLSLFSKALLTIISISLVLLFLHGSAPLHYYLIITPFIFIIMSELMVLLYKREGKFLKICIVTIIAYYSASSIYETIDLRTKLSSVPGVSGSYVPYVLIDKISSFIVRDSTGLPYSIKRTGPYDQFGADFAHKYQYLMWLKGNEPVLVGELEISPNKPVVEYTIIESDREDLGNQDFDERLNYENIMILKKYL